MTWLRALWRRMTARHPVCGCCWTPYHEGRARSCGCATDPEDENRCVELGTEPRPTVAPYRELFVEAPRRPWSKPLNVCDRCGHTYHGRQLQCASSVLQLPVAGPGKPRLG